MTPEEMIREGVEIRASVARRDDPTQIEIPAVSIGTVTKSRIG